MAQQYTISPANLRTIENELHSIHSEMGNVRKNVVESNAKVKEVDDRITALTKKFDDFVMLQVRANEKSSAQQRLIQIRQELEKRFGHYDQVRRTTTGIIQADDLGIVRADTISTATEELMISTPDYWLAPCLVALAAWINDQPELAEKALREAIKRNDEKTSLLFALICRRADRKQASLKWAQRYLMNQQAESLDRKTVIILDAYAGGLLGSDTEGVISKLIDSWLEKLSDKPGFFEAQTKQWSDAINLKRKPLHTDDYQYLRTYTDAWNQLNDVLEGAHPHNEIYNYLTNIFAQEGSMEPLKVQLDQILTDLVTEFDEEELELRKEETYNKFVVKYNGDVSRAQQSMVVEKSAFETHKSFTQLLTDAAMKPESSGSSVSTQKLAVALSKEWIENAYNDIIAQNRMKIPHQIQIVLEEFKAVTTDGNNEDEIIGSYQKYITESKEYILSQINLSSFEKFCKPAGITIGVLGGVMAVTGNVLLGPIAAIAGVGMFLKNKSKAKQCETQRQTVENNFAEMQEVGEQILRATLAEVVDFRSEFAAKDAESQKVIDFLDQIKPEQYVRKLSDSTRRIKV